MAAPGGLLERQIMHNTHRTAAGFAAALITLAVAFGAPQAHADAAGVKDCASQGGVYVTVAKPDGARQGACVTAPASGTAALQAAGFTFTKDASGMICAVNGYPDPCPATFDGNYWHYYQASADDALAGKWAYATTGPDDTKPQAGWVEGWCYGGEQDCLPMPADASPSTVDAPIATPSAITENVPTTQHVDTTPSIVDGPFDAGSLPWAQAHPGLITALAAISVVVVVVVVVAIVLGRSRRNK